MPLFFQMEYGPVMQKLRFVRQLDVNTGLEHIALVMKDAGCAVDVFLFILRCVFRSIQVHTEFSASCFFSFVVFPTSESVITSQVKWLKVPDFFVTSGKLGELPSLLFRILFYSQNIFTY